MVGIPTHSAGPVVSLLNCLDTHSMQPADPVVSVENPEGDTILDYSKPGGVEVTAGTVTRHRSGETVIDFSRTGARAAAPDLLTGDGAEESKAP